jgi:hypothetical protein
VGAQREPRSQACPNSGRACEMLDALVQKDAVLEQRWDGGALIGPALTASSTATRGDIPSVWSEPSKSRRATSCKRSSPSSRRRPGIDQDRPGERLARVAKAVPHVGCSVCARCHHSREKRNPGTRPGLATKNCRRTSGQRSVVKDRIASAALESMEQNG